MGKKIKINSWMKMILIELQGKTLTRKLLIEKASQVPKYAGPKQAEMFVSRNVFTLTQEGLLLVKGRLKQRTYEIGPELSLYLQEESACTAKREDVQILVTEEGRMVTELNMLSSEIEAYHEYYHRLPSKKALISSLLKTGKERSFVLNGKINAIRKILERDYDSRDYSK